MIGKSNMKIHGLKYIFLFIGFIFYSENNGFTDTVSENEHQNHKHQEAQKHNPERGKRLFYGLVKTEAGKAFDCPSCHYTRIIDTLNWNPSAFEIAVSTSK